MSASLDNQQLGRLGRVAAMFASPNDHEALAAARRFDGLLKAKGVTLGDVLAGNVDGWNSKELASFCCSNPKRLTAKELAFATNVYFRRSEPTPKQEQWLRDIAARLKAEGAQ